MIKPHSSVLKVLSIKTIDKDFLEIFLWCLVRNLNYTNSNTKTTRILKKKKNTHTQIHEILQIFLHRQSERKKKKTNKK